jgi:transcriptional regulator with XRE-family HTH domain
MQIKYKLDKVGIGSRLQEQRIRAGLTQESLAEAMGITDKYISKVENGAAAPSLSYVMKFSDIIETDVHYLLRGTKANAEKPSDGWMIKEAIPPYGDKQSRMSKKGQKICDELMTKIKEVLEENQI